MYIARVTNEQGDSLMLTGREKEWQVVSISGLDAPSAQVNMTKIAGMDGALKNSATVNTRNIVILLRINGDVGANRRTLNRYFHVKQTVTFYFEEGEMNVYAEGVVENIECDPFSISELYQVSIECPFPYFQDCYGDTYWLSNSARGFEFPFAIDLDEPVAFSEYEAGRVTEIENETGVETGFTLNAMFDTDQATSFTLQNVDTGESITISYSFQKGDLLAFDTRDTTLVIALKRDGSWYNMFPYMSSGFTILKLHSGINRLAYMTNGHFYDEFVDVRLFYRATWQGV